MSPFFYLLAAGLAASASVLVLANFALVVASLVGRREQMLRLLEPLATFASLFLLSDSPYGGGGEARRRHGAP
ncbi:MAG TPA: hypothetical protein VGD66_03770 [Allosphingosinicella sp.]|jgi:hypothetical protein